MIVLPFANKHLVMTIAEARELRKQLNEALDNESCSAFCSVHFAMRQADKSEERKLYCEPVDWPTCGD